MNENGVRRYTKATVEIFFPNGELACYWCPLMMRDPNLRDRCGKTGEILISPKHSIGFDCPLKFQPTEEGA